MAPIRVAIVGLSSSAKTAWASSAHLPYLLSDTGKAKYTIVALLNSSVQAAKAAIATYKLGDSVKAYGDPQSLAADPDVDLVVVNTRVDKHYETALPSVEAGKDVFVEWPLAHDAHHARVLAEKAQQAGGNTVVGLQGPLGPLPAKLKEVLASGRIGKVLSSEVRAFGGTNSRDSLPEGLKYFADLKVGGNLFTIGFGHFFDFFQSVLGDYATLHPSYIQVQRPEQKVLGADKNVLETVTSTSPDLIAVHGTLPASAYVSSKAILTIRVRRGPAFPGEQAFTWSIHGEKGEIRVVSPTTYGITIGSPEAPQSFEVHDFETDKVETVEWRFNEWQEELGFPARNIGAVYEEFARRKAEGKTIQGETKYATFDKAVRRHEQLDRLLKEAGFAI